MSKAWIEKVVSGGLAMWDLTYRQTRDEAEVRSILAARMARVGMTNPGIQGLVYWSAMWVDCGMPRVVLGQRHAAALMATSMPTDVMAAIRPPWRALLVDVPGDLLEYEHEGITQRIEHVTLRIHDTGDAAIVSVTDHERLTTFSASSFDALNDVDQGDYNEVTVSKRLVFGVCAELTRLRPTTSVGFGPAACRRSRRGLPETRIYALTRDVKVDARAAVRDYVRGAARGVPTVQSLVRGHWKRQPHGAGAADRKLIFVEPYWRGPEDAPIAVRAHDLGTKEPP